MPSQTLSALLVRPAPLGQGIERESMASWLYRLAIANGFGSYGELFSYERLKIPGNAALDVAPHRWDLVPALRQLSLVQEDSAQAHTLADELYALCGDPSGSTRRWILTADHRRGITGTTCHAICPDCLLADAVPYWRMSWRLSTTATCPKHRSLLVDVCPACGAAMAISGARTIDLGRCESCSLNLSFIPRQREPDTGFTWRAALPSSAGPHDFPIALSHSHLWWDGIRNMLSVFMRPRVLIKLARLTLPPPLELLVSNLSQSSRSEFDRHRVEIRHELLCLAEFLTTDWPHTFVKLMNQASITSAEFSTCEVVMPNWLSSVVRRDLNRKRYRVTEEEIKSARALLSAHRSGASKIAVKRLLGVKEAVAVDRALPSMRRRLSDEEFLRVLMMLDHDIEVAPAGREVQASMLRDAVCIATAAWLRISFSKASRLDLQAADALVVSWSEAAQASTVRGQTAQISSRWMALYLRGTRVRFERFDRPQTALFISRFGIPTQGFSLAGRFASLLRRNGIDEWARGSHLLTNDPSPPRNAQGRSRSVDTSVVRGASVQLAARGHRKLAM